MSSNPTANFSVSPHIEAGTRGRIGSLVLERGVEDLLTLLNDSKQPGNVCSLGIKVFWMSERPVRMLFYWGANADTPGDAEIRSLLRGEPDSIQHPPRKVQLIEVPEDHCAIIAELWCGSAFEVAYLFQTESLFHEWFGLTTTWEGPFLPKSLLAFQRDFKYAKWNLEQAVSDRLAY